MSKLMLLLANTVGAIELAGAMELASSFSRAILNGSNQLFFSF
jgi:hypothetical protein